MKRPSKSEEEMTPKQLFERYAKNHPKELAELRQLVHEDMVRCGVTDGVMPDLPILWASNSKES